MNFTKYLLFALLFILTPGCGEEEVTGCTDPNAANYDPLANVESGDCVYPGCTDEDSDNYDPMANQDNGTCTFFDLYVGTYSGNFMCESTFADLLDEASSQITKKPGEENTDEITVIVSNPATEITLLLDGTITKDEAVIDTYIQNFEYTLEVGPLVVEGPFEVFVTGTLARDENGGLSGPISIRIDKTDLALSVSDTCVYTATKN